jgi:phosphonopyruvate decarboxylase
MISVEDFFTILKNLEVDFFTGVPDSVLKNFTEYLIKYINQSNLVISSNEGSAVGIGIGYHLASNKVPLIFMQNSGLGNAFNPLASLAHKNVYEVPMILLIGWRGAKSFQDEPQHIPQGSITQEMLDLLKIPVLTLNESTDLDVFKVNLSNSLLNCHSPISILVEPNTFKKYSETIKSK